MPRRGDEAVAPVTFGAQKRAGAQKRVAHKKKTPLV
jgi:hypothetical protein